MVDSLQPPSQDAPIVVVYIEDDDRLARLTARYLESHRVRVEIANDGREGIALVQRVHPDVVLLDVMLPGLDGHQVCRELRTRSAAPIVMLTARGEEADRVMGLEGGADDYVAKPCSSRELLARIRAHARRGRGLVGPSSTEVVVGRLRIDPQRVSAELDGRALALTTYEFRLLLALAERAGRVVAREQLVEIVRGSAEEAFDRSVDVHVSHLRQKLGDDPRHPTILKTIRGMGYLLAGGRDG
jgi:DNA-binding response OmpR family regulator